MTDYDDQDRDDRDEDAPPRGALTAPAPAPRANQIARQGFSENSLAMGSAQTDALVAASRAMTEARWIMAMRNPRNLLDVRQTILGECKRPGFADVATYARPVGRAHDEKTDTWVDTFAEGLSIRFAEVAMRCMGNMQCKATTIYDDERSRMITVSAVDYETNATWDIDITIPKTVERKKLKRGQKPLGGRVNSSGNRVFIVEATDGEVATKAAAEISKASRTAILRLVPGEIQDEAFDLCRRISSDKAAKDPKAAIKRMLDAFAEIAVKPSEIATWLGKPIEAGTRDEFVQLSKISSGIREGDLLWADVISDRIAERAEAAKRAPAAPAMRAEADPASSTVAAPAAAVAPAVDPVPQPAAPTAPAKPAASRTLRSPAGKGTEALKGALRKPEPKPDQRDDEPSWMSGEAEPAKPGLDLQGLPPVEAGYEYRGCARCNAVIEVLVSDPPGGKCYACTAAERDAD